jgi:hypothetical protein
MPSVACQPSPQCPFDPDAHAVPPTRLAPPHPRRRALAPAIATPVVSLLAATFAFARPLDAQLRPLDPLDWRAFDAPEPVRIELGIAALDGQRASLAGVRGRLWELGLLQASWRTGRVLFVASGTVLRLFRDQAVIEEPDDGVTAHAGGLRRDAGDWKVATAVRLTPEAAPVDVALRFGTRLPTTDNRVGLERDATDFFALVAARWRSGDLSLAAESGLGINGTRDPDFEQSDVWTYVLSVEYRRGRLTSRIELLGQMDGLESRAPRGTEELGELRLSLRTGEARWVELSLVRGLAEFSPAFGVAIAAGLALPPRRDAAHLRRGQPVDGGSACSRR